MRSESPIGSLAEIGQRLQQVQNGVHWTREPDHRWSVAAGEDRWSVHIVPGLIRNCRPDWANLAPRQFLVVDEGFWSAGGQAVADYLTHFGVEYDIARVPAGEAAKELPVLHEIVRHLGRVGVAKTGPIVAVGGGAVADVARGAAALWRRGTVAACVMTTPLAAVDAGIGLKWFLDLESEGVRLKNPLGGFAPALATLIDPELFATVPPEHVSSGTAEILKMGIAVDTEILRLLEASGREMQARAWADPEGLPTLALAIHRMLEALQRNPREKNKRRSVDFGHFVGKVIELRATPPMPHGHSVALCTALTLVLAASRREPRGLIRWPDAERVLRLMVALGLPIWDPLMNRATFTAAIVEVVAQRGKQNIPVPQPFDTRSRDEPVVWLQDVTVAELESAERALKAWAAKHGR